MVSKRFHWFIIALIAIIWAVAVPFAVEWYIYFNRADLAQCLYTHDTVKTSSMTTVCLKPPPSATGEATEGSNATSGIDFISGTSQFTDIASSTFIIDQSNMPAEIQRIELQGIDGQNIVMWENKKRQ